MSVESYAPPSTLNRRLGFRLVQVILGLLLLAAAGLKTVGLAVDPVARIGIFYSPSFQTLVIQFEFLIGLWLLSGFWRIGSYLVAFAAFAVFAAFSFYSGWIGQADCGCFGAIKVNPWLPFGVDVAIVACLVFSRPRISSFLQGPERRVPYKRILTAAMICIFVLGTGYGMVHVAFGSLARALAILRGETVSVAPAIVDVGEGLPGVWVESYLVVTNWTDSDIRVVGGTSDCSCSTTSELPMIIGNGQSRSVRIYVRLPDTAGITTRTAMLVIDQDGLRPISFPLTGIAVDARNAKEQL